MKRHRRYSGTRLFIVLYIIKAFWCFFRRIDSLAQLRVDRMWCEFVSKGNFEISLAARVCNFLELITKVATDTIPNRAAIIKMRQN